VVERTATRLVMALEATEPEPGDWPWPISALQWVEIDGASLTLGLSVTNLGDRPMPAGIGHHPYFRKPPGTRLRVALGEAWLNDDAMLPVVKRPTPPEWDFADGPTLDATIVDNCFAGWDGHAEIRWPDRPTGLAITADPVFDHCVVFVPAGRDYFCVEPVSHRNDAIRAAGQGGMALLAGGGVLAGTLRFALA
jgi:aldose 1-epimerase